VIVPVDASIVKPACAEKVPPEVPISVTFCTPSEGHHGEPVYEMEAEGGGVTIIVIVLEVDGLPVTHNKDDVITTSTASLLASVVDVKLGLFDPTSDPFTFH
jgi:hypothetical protein